MGPNGAGKTTLLRLAVGLTRPSAGSVRVFGLDPREGAAEVLPRVGFLAQEHPLYGGFSVEEMLRFGRKLNPGWEDAAARARIAELELPLRKKVRNLSGGQRAQVALTLALAKQPELLLLDEPVASLDPLARREFLQSVLEVVAERELTVVLSSHILADLERTCDHLIVLVDSRVRLAGDMDDIIDSHVRLSGPRDLGHPGELVTARRTDVQSTMVIRYRGPIADPAWTVGKLSLEDIVLAYMERPVPAEPRVLEVAR